MALLRVRRPAGSPLWVAPPGSDDRRYGWATSPNVSPMTVTHTTVIGSRYPAEAGSVRPATPNPPPQTLAVSDRSIAVHVSDRDRSDCGDSDCGDSDCGHSDCGHSDCSHSDCGHSGSGVSLRCPTADSVAPPRRRRPARRAAPGRTSRAPARRHPVHVASRRVHATQDRKSVVEGKSVDLGGHRSMTKHQTVTNT